MPSARIETRPSEPNEFHVTALHSGGRVSVAFEDGLPGGVMATLKIRNRTMHTVPAEQLDEVVAAGVPFTLRLENKGNVDRRLRVMLPE